VASSSSKKYALSGNQGSKKQRKQENLLLLCGPTGSGKTALFYHLLTKEVRTTVTSQEINETPTQMEVKIPQSVSGNQDGSIAKKLAVADIPGHFHYREQLKDTVEIARAIVVLIDAKEKYDSTFHLNFV
jgi:septin family protein